MVAVQRITAYDNVPVGLHRYRCRGIQAAPQTGADPAGAVAKAVIQLSVGPVPGQEEVSFDTADGGANRQHIGIGTATYIREIQRLNARINN